MFNEILQKRYVFAKLKTHTIRLFAVFFSRRPRLFAREVSEKAIFQPRKSRQVARRAARV